MCRMEAYLRGILLCCRMGSEVVEVAIGMFAVAVIFATMVLVLYVS